MEALKQAGYSLSSTQIVQLGTKNSGGYIPESETSFVRIDVYTRKTEVAGQVETETLMTQVNVQRYTANHRNTTCRATLVKLVKVVDAN